MNASNWSFAFAVIQLLLIACSHKNTWESGLHLTGGFGKPKTEYNMIPRYDNT